MLEVYKTKRKEKPSTRKLIYRQTVEELLIAIVLVMICAPHTHTQIYVHTRVYTYMYTYTYPTYMGRTLNCIHYDMRIMCNTVSIPISILWIINLRERERERGRERRPSAGKLAAINISIYVCMYIQHTPIDKLRSS